MHEIEEGRISLANFTKLIANVAENKSNKLLPLKEARILLRNTAELRKLILGRRNFNILNYCPMPIENELEKVEYFYRRLVLYGIIVEEEKGNYSLDTLGSLWNDFCLVRKYEYFDVPAGWNDFGLATKAKNKLAEILLTILEEELNKKSSEIRQDQLMQCLSAVHASYNFSDSTAKKTTVLMKKFDPSNKYDHKWLQPDGLAGL